MRSPARPIGPFRINISTSLLMSFDALTRLTSQEAGGLANALVSLARLGLPLRREETEDSSQQPDKAVPSAYAAFSVLVVDDDFLGREVASCFLETLGVGSIPIAVNGFEGLRMLTTHAPFTLVLMDLVMPAMDGFACVRRLRLVRGRSSRARRTFVSSPSRPSRSAHA